MQFKNLSSKQIVATILTAVTGVLIIYFGVSFLWSILFHAELTINLEDKAVVTVLDSEQQSVKDLGEKEGSFTIRIASGTYHVESTSDQSKTRNTVDLKQSDKQQINVDFKRTKNSNEALYINDGSVDKIAAGNNTLYAHENQQGYIYYYRPSQTTDRVVANLKGSGLLEYNRKPVAVSLDETEGISMYALNKGSVNNVESVSSSSSVKVATDTFTNRYAVVNYTESTVQYFEGLNDKSPQIIAEFTDIVPEITFANEQVLVYYPAALIKQEESVDSNDLSAYTSRRFSTSTNEVTALKVLATQSINTKDGLVFGTENGIFLDNELIENSKVRLLEGVASGFIFELNDDVWEYDSESGNSYLVAQNSNRIIDATSMNGELYLLVQDGRNRSILRINDTADILLPSEVIGYENDMFRIESNFLFGSKPQLTITTFGIINGPQQYNLFKSQTLEYRKAARQYLKSQGLNLSNYKVEYTPSL